MKECTWMEKEANSWYHIRGSVKVLLAIDRNVDIDDKDSAGRNPHIL